MLSFGRRNSKERESQEQHDERFPTFESTIPQHEVRDSTTMAAVVRQHETWDQKQQPRGGMSRTKSLFVMASSSAVSISGSSTSSSGCCYEPSTSSSSEASQSLAEDVKKCVGEAQAPDFENNGALRRAMEPHLRRARLLREDLRVASHPVLYNADCIASSMGVPYAALRQERPFLYDECTHPLHSVLAQALDVPDLTQVHLHHSERDLLLPLLDRERRFAFHAAYDTFVTSFCIPLLHSMAISKHIFRHSDSDRITYRYQAFPNIRVSRPGDPAISQPTCDSTRGHSLGFLTFHIPLTPCAGTNCLYTESRGGKEDWHALSAKSVGLGYLMDGARCLQFDLANTTNASAVALTFRVMLYREDWTGLCSPNLREDRYSKAGPGYYDEAVIDLRNPNNAVVKKHGRRLLLLDPDHRVGYPFT